ncbi:2'-5' RNA ligase family protein [Rhodococcus ruber]|uniref:2'-5' RNA ligase family protein n=1 Tax=Rhodococcus ruber TaxID=1830 RepID=UPI00137792E1|nr:2'-5' RNA ligase family protein [Rhodococcus ruber]
MAGYEGITIALALTPGFDSLLERARHLAPTAVRPLPAHITIAMPFLSLSEVKRGTLNELSDLVSEVMPTHVEGRKLVASDRGFLGVEVPEFTPVLERVQAKWPALTPYDGRYGDESRPHVTISTKAEPSQLETLRELADVALPLTSAVMGPVVVTMEGGQWRLVGAEVG